MKVEKRNGSTEDVSFDKVLKRIACLCKDTIIEPVAIAQKVCNRIYDGVKTKELDEFTSSLCISMITEHPDYGKLASRIIISNNHKNTSPSFSETMTILYGNTDIHGINKPIISEKMFKTIMKHKNKLNHHIRYERDYLIDYFGFKTLERAYLAKIGKEVAERPQHMWMRVSLGIHGRNIKDALETYDLMSKKYFTHATPTLFNAGTPRPQMSSCYLLGTEDSIEGIFKTVSDCGKISKWAGGIGIHISNIRGGGSQIRGTNGYSNGIIPMLKVYNEVARYVDQGGGKRKGSIAVYIEPWHPDIEAFLEIKKNHGDENQRARDLFTALWIPDLFMKRVEEDSMWNLFCPDQCPGLCESIGDEFEELYHKYETEGKSRKEIRARDLWYAILSSQIETGTPYMLYKDACNKKSNQQNVGVIKSSNLCAEIIEYSDKDNYAVCNLASISLGIFVENGEYDFDKLYKIAKIATRNLNKIIDGNFYPTPETKKSNFSLRPIGLGVQGFADALFKMRLPFDSPEARQLNKNIFETIYYAAVETSCEISKKAGPYGKFIGSPASKGMLQFDLWGVEPSDRYDWAKLKEDVKEYGLRNSLLTALMPTASTSQILGNFECFEAITSNIYVRRTIAGEFIVVNKYLVEDLIELGIWNSDLKNDIIRDGGSIQGIPNIPDDLKALYKTVWEISQKHIIDLAADRGAYIDQSQSMNLFMAEPSFDKLTSMHFYAWKKGLKTGQYYLRSKPKTTAQQFTVVQKKLCSIQNREECEMCSG